MTWPTGLEGRLGPARYVSDLERCLPQEALSVSPKRHHWRLIPYETEHFAGTMLLAGEETVPPPVTYPLAERGWYAISIGMFVERFEGTLALQVKLTGDPAFSILTLPAGPQRLFEEVFWKVADVTDQEIAFRQLYGAVDENGDLNGYPGTKARVAYIKLEPLADDAVPAFQADHQGADRRLYAHNDAHGFYYMLRVTTPEDIRREIEPYRHTDFSRLYWEAGMGDMTYYLSQIGRTLTCDGVEDFQYIGERLHAEAWRTLRKEGIDPLRIAADAAHEMGLELHASYRPGGFHFPAPGDAWNRDGFFERHPELHAIARDGRPSPRISYTFPATRRYVLSLLREIAQYPVDGIAILFVRRPPLVGYEPPLVEGFKAEYGLDPFTLDDRDARWLTYRCRILTQFMRQVRQEMDAISRQQKRTKRIQVTAVVSGREDENFYYGMRIKDWIAEGLVDTIVPYTMAPDLDSAAVSWTDMRDVAYWVNLTSGTSCELALSILPRWMPPADFRRKAAELYGAGAERFFFWDCSGIANYVDQHGWNAVRRLGHRAEIEAWMQAGQPALDPPGLFPTCVGDWRIASQFHDTPG